MVQQTRNPADERVRQRGNERAKQDALCQSLIDQSHQEFDYEVEAAVHPEKLLTKCFLTQSFGLRQRDLSNQIFFVANEHDGRELGTTGAAIGTIVFGVDQNRVPDHNHRQEGLGDAADWQERDGAQAL